MPTTTNKTFCGQGLEYNLATQSKWFAQIPLNTIFTDYGPKDLCFNLTTYALPEIELGFTEVKYLTKAIPVPSRVIAPGPNDITFTYLMSSTYNQWVMLYRWLQRITVELQHDTNIQDIGDRTKYTVPINVYLLSEFKTPVLNISYKDCWLQKLGEIAFDYRDAQDTPIVHSFTVKYSHFEINVLQDIGGSDGRATSLPQAT
jgi:hypothetical protein